MPTEIPQIRQFDVTPLFAMSGATIHVTWDVEADSVAIDVLSESGDLISTEALETQGTLDLTARLDQGTLIIRLRVIRGGNTMTRSVPVTVTCRYQWFFTPAPSPCAPEDATSVPVEFQKFQYGVGLYIASLDTVYILADHGSQFIACPYKADDYPTALAPTPLVDPVDHIGWVWHTQRWPDGSSLLGVVGWGVGAGRNFQGPLQRGIAPGVFYVQAPDGTVYQLPLSDTGVWAIISPQSAGNP